MKPLFFTFFLVLLLSGCGEIQQGGNPQTGPGPTNPEPSPGPNPGPSPTKRLTLALFGANWCDECKAKFPEINAGLKDVLEKNGGAVKGMLYVPTGDKKFDPPSVEAAERYRAKLALDFEAQPDLDNWSMYRKHVQKKPVLPAAVIFDEKGEVLRVFKPGTTTFVVEELVSFVKENLSKR